MPDNLDDIGPITMANAILSGLGRNFSLQVNQCSRLPWEVDKFLEPIVKAEVMRDSNVSRLMGELRVLCEAVAPHLVVHLEEIFKLKERILATKSRSDKESLANYIREHQYEKVYGDEMHWREEEQRRFAERQKEAEEKQRIMVEEEARTRSQNIQKIKKIVLDLGTKFTRLQVAEIAESCKVTDENLIIQTVQDMIAKHQIDAQYFASTKAVAFNQQANLAARDAFIAELEAEFANWGKDAHQGRKKS